MILRRNASNNRTVTHRLIVLRVISLRLILILIISVCSITVSRNVSHILIMRGTITHSHLRPVLRNTANVRAALIHLTIRRTVNNMSRSDILMSYQQSRSIQRQHNNIMMRYITLRTLYHNRRSGVVMRRYLLHNNIMYTPIQRGLLIILRRLTAVVRMHILMRAIMIRTINM